MSNPLEGNDIAAKRAAGTASRTEVRRAELRLDAQCGVLRMLNQAEAILTGWVLKEDAEKVSALFSPLYDLCDKD